MTSLDENAFTSRSTKRLSVELDGKTSSSRFKTPPERTENNRDLSAIIKSLEANCRGCSPISPLQCIDRCQTYKLKNELRTLRKALANPSYLKELFNVLKNETRLLILQTIANGRFNVGQLQQKLKEAGQSHSQSTICDEYMHPLMAVGLAAQVGEEYYATAFGLRLMQVTRGLSRVRSKSCLPDQNATKKLFCKRCLLDQKPSRTSSRLFYKKTFHAYSNAYAKPN